MSRLIDADYLKQMLDVACGTNRNAFDIADAVYKFAIKTIEDAPTVEISDYDTGYQDGLEDGLNDIRPHGEWLEDSGNIACSHCHTIWLYRRTDFCPHCGADMRGGRE